MGGVRDGPATPKCTSDPFYFNTSLSLLMLDNRVSVTKTPQLNCTPSLQTLFEGDGASGCLNSLGSLTATSLATIESETTRAKWITGQWSPCSKFCGGGTIQRDVTCVDKDDSSATLEDSNCFFLDTDKPSSSETCHDFSCDIEESALQDQEDVCVYDTVSLHTTYRENTNYWQVTDYSFYNAYGAQSRCTWELFYNDKCDDVCNTKR